MTTEDLFTLLSSPTARKALVASIYAAENDDELPVDRPCQRCGRHFDAGVFNIVNGRVVEITCWACDQSRGPG
jgi:hypothetical protein